MEPSSPTLERLAVARHAQTALAYLEDIANLRWLTPRPSIMGSDTLALLAAMKQEFHLAEINEISQLNLTPIDPQQVRIDMRDSSLSWPEIEGQHNHLSPVELLSDVTTLVQQLTGVDSSTDFALLLVQNQLERALKRCQELESKLHLTTYSAASGSPPDPETTYVNPRTGEPMDEEGSITTIKIETGNEESSSTGSYLEFLKHRRSSDQLDQHQTAYLKGITRYQVPAIRSFMSHCLDAISELQKCGQDYKVLRSNLLQTLARHLPYFLPVPTSMTNHQLLMEARQYGGEGVVRFHRRLLQLWVDNYPSRYPESNAIMLYMDGMQREFSRKYPRMTVEFVLPNSYSAASIKALNVIRTLKATRSSCPSNDQIRSLRLTTRNERDELTAIATRLDPLAEPSINKAAYRMGLIN